jgi:hypothetical protein
MEVSHLEPNLRSDILSPLSFLFIRNKSPGTAHTQVVGGITQKHEYLEAGITGSTFRNCPPQGP